MFAKKQRELKRLRIETEKMSEELKRLRDIEEDYAYENHCLNQRCEEIGTIRDILVKIIVGAEETDYEALYNELADICDPEGFTLYDVAKDITHIDVCSFFPTEDCLGRFENANGRDLVGWITKAKFGDIEWEQLNAPYEIAASVSFEGRDKEIDDFYKKLYKETALKLLK